MLLSVQECRTWLNVASNQELNKSDYDTVAQSYSSALECARRAGDAKLQVFIPLCCCHYSISNFIFYAMS